MIIRLNIFLFIASIKSGEISIKLVQANYGHSIVYEARFIVFLKKGRNF